MARRAFYKAEIDEDRDTAEELDSVLTAHPGGLAHFSPRPAFASDPSQLGWPPTLPIELALRVDSTREICTSHGIDRDEWDSIRENPAFVADLKRAVEMVRSEGGSFKARSQLQAGEYLKEAWRMVHDPAVPANVRAGLIANTVRWSGLDASREQGQGGGTGTNFMIAINLA